MVGGGCEQAIKARCCVAWGKFRKLLPILTSKHLPLVVRGKVYSTCVRSAMLHGGETWAPNVSDLQHLRRNDRAMIRWICNTKLTDNLSTELLLQRLIYGIEECLRLQRLRWYGHVRTASVGLTRTLTWLSLVLVGREDQGKLGQNSVSRMTYQHTI